MNAQHFKQEEFREWADDMSPRLVTMLDVLRFRLGSPIHISAHSESLGRELGRHDRSAHNVDHWGQVLAADCFIAGVHLREQVESVVNEARGLGFTGIGVYTGTSNNRGEPQPMFHFDVRPTRNMGGPAEWGRIDSKPVTLMCALQSIQRGGESHD